MWLVGLNILLKYKHLDKNICSQVALKTENITPFRDLKRPRGV